MTSHTSLPFTDQTDADLVELSLAGDRHAFTQIVARYQSLVCALAYSATGSRSQSEDLAQETFLTAWRQMRALNDPTRLCAWLCGIARNVIRSDRRRLERQPAHAASALETDLPGREPAPSAQAISNEEMAILWREISQLPETYREPLILYYRENKSVEHVAAALEISPEAVMQRLSRGRRQLQERMLEFVETTLQRSNPGAGFTLQIEAALPLLTVASGPAIVAGKTSAGAAVKSGILAFLLAWIAPLVGTVAAVGVTWDQIAHAPTQRERRFIARWMLLLWLSAAACVVAVPTISWWARSTGLDRRQDWLATAPFVAVWFAMAMLTVTCIVLLARGSAALRRELARSEAQGAPVESQRSSDAPRPATSLARQIALVGGVLLAGFWVLILVAWMAGDRVGAAGIVGTLLVLGAFPFLDPRRRRADPGKDQGGGGYLAVCGLVFLAILNWRLDTWLAPIYGVESVAMHRLLPMALVHLLSVIVVAWTGALVFVTRPDQQ